MENFVVDIWEAAKAASPFATMVIMVIWLKTDRERLKLQGERDALLERVLKSNEELSSAIESIIKVAESRRR
jgi:hypothetical protein